MQTARTILAAGLLSLAIFGLPLSAQTLSGSDQAAVEAAVDGFNTAFENADYSTVITSMPPKIKTYISEQAQISVEQLETMMIEQTQAALASVTIDSFAMETADATYGTTSEDRPYALIPTNTQMTVPNVGKVEGITSTLALKDDGAWYLLRIEEQQQIDLLLAVFPDFSGIDFPAGSVEVVE